MPAKSSPNPNRPPEAAGGHAGGIEGRLESFKFGGGEKMTPFWIFSQFQDDMTRMKKELDQKIDGVELIVQRRALTLITMHGDFKKMDSTVQNLGAEVDKLSIEVDTMHHQLNPPAPSYVEPEQYEDNSPRQESPRYGRNERDEEQSYDPRYEEPRPRNRRYSDDVYDGYEPAY